MDRISMPVKISISAFCILAIAFLFFFGGVFFPDNTDVLSAPQTEENYRDAFQFDSEELTYDGTGELDFLQGVSLDNYTARELKDMVFIRISTGDNLSQKVVEYTADTEEGRARSRRLLQLKKYKGPKIELPDDMPAATPSTVDHLAELMSSEDDFKADDGFGRDARKYVQVETEKAKQNSALVYCTFILENEFSDRVVAKSDLILTGMPATISLTDSVVYINKGEGFDPSLYVESAVDADGRPIPDEVYCDGELDTTQPGTYEIYYGLRDQSAVLTVIVTEKERWQ